nr:RNA-directed DNA polymerase [Frigoribacterium endophyticum]
MSTFNSYFVYDKYAFAGQFYDSHEWHALEARWTYLTRLDVANCFRSIYTHSASWSTGTDFFSKENLGNGPSKDLGNSMDSIMQVANWGETHGICIGPEVSRVFAEVVFQHLGLEMRARVAAAGIDSSEYEILRYVDDYFIFTDESRTLDTITGIVEAVLMEHKFSLNRNKTRTYTTPFTTSISVKKANLKSFLRTALSVEGAIPVISEREISIQTKALIVGGDSDEANVGMSLTQVEKMLVRFLEKRLPKCVNREEAEETLGYAWGFAHDMLFQYLSNPSVASAMKVVRVLRFYFLSPTLLTLSEHEQAAAQFRVEENVNFAIHKALQRLVDVANSDVEMCHFLSLAAACSIRFEPSSKLVAALLRRTGLAAPRAKTNQSLVFLLLAVAKYFFANPETPSWIRTTLISSLSQLTDELLSSGFIPGKIQSHASQELIVLAITTCVWLSVDEKMKILKRPWLLQLLQRALYPRDGGAKASTRFLRRCLEEVSETPADNVDSLPRVFEWSDAHFDKLLYEKQAQFIY